jgi:pimeloyl-ACP methyl ester carboxylesterase
MRLTAWAWAVLLTTSGSALAQRPGGGPATPVPNAQVITLDASKPHSSARDVLHRLGVPDMAMAENLARAEYDLADERFDLVVPPEFAPDAGWGAIVWISPGESGSNFLSQWPTLLTKHKLLWIGARNSGNQRPMAIRACLALDAAAAIQERYAIDPSRLYVAGFSGGARMSSMLGLLYPEVFAGGIYMDGVNYYKDMPVPGKPRTAWKRSFAIGDPKSLAVARRQSRHVLMTSEKDANRDQTHATWRAFQIDGFAHVHYIEVPKIGHTPAGQEWVDQAIEFLDQRPAASSATRPAAQAGRAPSPSR